MLNFIKKLFRVEPSVSQVPDDLQHCIHVVSTMCDDIARQLQHKKSHYTDLPVSERDHIRGPFCYYQAPLKDVLFKTYCNDGSWLLEYRPHGSRFETLLLFSNNFRAIHTNDQNQDMLGSPKNHIMKFTYDFGQGRICIAKVHIRGQYEDHIVTTAHADSMMTQAFTTLQDVSKKISSLSI